MGRCQTGGCVEWIHVFGKHLETDYCCCVIPAPGPAPDGLLLCKQCGLTIYRATEAKEGEESQADETSRIASLMDQECTGRGQRPEQKPEHHDTLHNGGI